MNRGSAAQVRIPGTQSSLPPSNPLVSNLIVSDRPLNRSLSLDPTRRVTRSQTRAAATLTTTRHRSVDLGAVQIVIPERTTLVQNVASRRLVGTGLTTQRPPTDIRVSHLEASAEERLGEARASTTWASYSSTFKMFLDFISAIEPEDHPDWATLIIWFVEWKIERGDCKQMSTAKQYTKVLVPNLRLLGHPVNQEAIQEYRSALDRQGARVPANQAEPATREDIDRALTKCTESEAIGLILAWLTASRIGEIPYLIRESLENPTLDQWIVEFPYHKGDPFRLGTAQVIRAGKYHTRLRQYWDRLRPNQAMSSLTTDRAAALLASINPKLSAHSVKRGALVTLLRAGVPMPILQHLAKHKDIETLFIYLPRREVALALGYDAATAALSL